MRSSLKPFLCICVLSAIGCSPQNSPQPVAVNVEAPKPSGELVPHPEYVNWSQFPVETTVVRRDQLASESGDLYQVTTIRLASKSEKEVAVEHQTTIERGTEKEIGEVISFSYPAQFNLPAGMEMAQFDGPSMKAELTGQETLEIAGKEYTLDVYEYVDTAEAGPLPTKLWRSSSIPGKQAKKEILGPDGQVLSASTTIEITIPE